MRGVGKPGGQRCLTLNLTRAAAGLTDPKLAKATTATIRRKLIIVPARVAASARRITLHLPQAWPWETAPTNHTARQDILVICQGLPDTGGCRHSPAAMKPKGAINAQCQVRRRPGSAACPRSGIEPDLYLDLTIPVRQWLWRVGGSGNARSRDRGRPAGPRGDRWSGCLGEYERDRLSFLLAARDTYGGAVAFDRNTTVINDWEMATCVLDNA